MIYVTFAAFFQTVHVNKTFWLFLSGQAAVIASVTCDIERKTQTRETEQLQTQR